jgi:hypothetical protein
MRCCDLSRALCYEFSSFIHFIFRSRIRLCRASLGIVAPLDVVVDREEVAERKRRERDKLAR